MTMGMQGNIPCHPPASTLSNQTSSQQWAWFDIAHEVEPSRGIFWTAASSGSEAYAYLL